MRITPQQITNNTVRAASQHNQRLYELQQQISSGTRLNRPSDAPADMSDWLAGRSLLGRIEVDLQNITVVRSNLNQTVSQLVSAKDGFTRAKTLAIDGVQSSEKGPLADEVNGILNLLIEIANSTDGANAIFSGISGARPFAVNENTPEGEIAGVQYNGHSAQSKIVVGRELTVEAFFSGEEVFLSKSRGETYYSSNTGAQSGSGTDTFSGNAKLTVRHTGATLSGASGLSLSAASTDRNTLIGQRQITINATDQTITLGGGLAVSFDGSETDLALIDEHGATLVVDVTGLAPGFDGTVDVQGDGVFSMDGGTTEQVITFADNQVWEHTASGTVSYVNTTDIHRSGEDIVETVGTHDAFSALVQLRDDLRNVRGLEGDEWTAALQRRIEDVDRIHDHILKVVGDVSVSLQTIDAIELRAENYQIDTTAKVSDLEATDMVKAIAELQSEQNLLQYTYAASSNLINGTSLLDFLR